MTEEMSETPKWRPIETAPKDGSNLVFGSDDGFQGFAQWAGDRWRLDLNGDWSKPTTKWAPTLTHPTKDMNE